MGKRFTISGIEHLIRMLNQYPQLLSLSSLAPITNVAKQAKDAVARAGCNCKAGPIYAANRNIFELALHNLQYGDHMLAKSALSVDEICYYTKDHSGKYILKCV